MERMLSCFVCTLAVLALAGCGGGGGGKGKSEPAAVNWKSVSHLGVSLKVPDSFLKAPGSADAVQYLYKGGQAQIGIEMGKMDEEEGLEELYKKEYEKRQADTRKARKNNDAYQIIRKEDTTFGGKKAFEVEQEYLSGAGGERAHDVILCVDMGGGKLLTLFWRVSDVKQKGMAWDKIHPRFFKESRASAKMQ